MRLTIGKKILAGFILAQLIGAGLVLGWYFFTVQGELAALGSANAEKAVLRSIEGTADYFGPVGLVARTGQRLLAGGVLDRDRPEHLERFLFEQLRIRRNVAGLYVGYPDGAFYYVMRSDKVAPGGTRTKIVEPAGAEGGRQVDLIWRGADFTRIKSEIDPQDNYDPRTRPWYRKAAEVAEPVWTAPYVFFTSSQPGITTAAAVPAGDGTVAAVVGVDIDMSAISRFLAKTGFGNGGSAYILAPSGEIVAHSRSSMVFVDGGSDAGGTRFRKVGELSGVEGRVGSAVLAGDVRQDNPETPVVWETEHNGNSYFAAVGQITDANWPWHIVVVMPAVRFVDAVRNSTALLIAALLIAGAVAVAVALTVSRDIARALATLHHNARLARGGNFEVMDEIETGYVEIDDTASALRELAERQRDRGG